MDEEAEEAAMNAVNKWCWCVALPPPSAGEELVEIDEEQVKKNVRANAAAVVTLSDGVGIAISKDLLLTSHSTVPSVDSARGGVAKISDQQHQRQCALNPDRFFVTNCEMDLTLVEGDGDETMPTIEFSSKGAKQTLEVGEKVYIVGHPMGSKERRTASFGEGNVVSKQDKYVRLVCNGLPWASGSAGFNEQGEFAFIISQPPQAATNASSNSKQIGVLIRDICKNNTGNHSFQ